MTSPNRTPRPRPGEEIWETTTNARVWVRTTDERGRERDISVGGKTGSRLRIKTADRDAMQDYIGDNQSDPFTNGMLKRVDANQQDDPATASDQAFSTEELMGFFGKSGNAFQAQVRKLNELNVRRMRQMAEEVDASASQIAFLEEHIEKNFRIHGAMPTYAEIAGQASTG